MREYQRGFLLFFVWCLMMAGVVWGQDAPGKADRENVVSVSAVGEFSGKFGAVHEVKTRLVIPAGGLEAFHAILTVDEGCDGSMILLDQAGREVTIADCFGPEDRTEYLTSLFLPAGTYQLILKVMNSESPDVSWHLKTLPLPPVTDEEIDRALHKALDFLKAKQQENGDFGEGFWSAGINGLALQALMGAEGGNRNDWPAIFKGVDFLKTFYRDPALITETRDRMLFSGAIMAEVEQGMYEHGIALTALIEAWTLGVEAGLEPIVKNALAFLLRGQLTAERPPELEGPISPENPGFGGWRYFVSSTDADLSVSAWQIIALLAAKKAGLDVPPQRLELARQFIRNCYEPTEKSFSYMVGTRDTVVGRCAMGALSLHLLGGSDYPEFQIALQEMLRRPPIWLGEPGGLYPFYYWYYGTRVAYLLGGDIWRVWRQNVCGILVRHQDADGSWRLNHSEHRSGKTYITALGALMLEIGAGYPPFYLRKDAAPKRAPVRVPEEIAVSLLNPIPGAVVVGSTEIVAQPKGSSNVVVKALRFYVNDQVIGTATAEPWTCVWDFGPQARSHKIKVEVESSTGKKATAEVKTRQPVDQIQVKIHRPSAKVVVGEEVIIVEAAGHPESPLDRVTVSVNGEEIYSGEEPPGELSYSFPAGHAHTIIAEAVNVNGRRASDTVTTLEPPNEITVSLQDPREKDLMRGPGRIVAVPQVPEGNQIRKVTFFVDGEEVGVVEQAPWELDFDFGETAKAHQIKVMAENASGKTAQAEISTRTPKNDIEVVIRSPRDSMVAGEQSIDVEAVSSPESPLVTLVVAVDGVEVHSGDQSSVSFPHDFGTQPTRHVITATAKNEAGKTADDRVETLAPPPLEVDLTAIVTDSRNQHILDLRREDFRMSEDGIPQEITRFSRETVPVHVALVIDTSGSMKRSIPEVQKAASHFISGLQPRDQIVLMEFSDDVNVLHDFSSDSQALIAGVKKIKALRGTALYDAVVAACRKLRERGGKTVIVLLSDGKDENNAGTRPGSKNTLEQAVQAAKETGAIIYALGLGKKPAKEFLDLLAQETGGRAYYPPTAKDLADVYARIAAEFRCQYSLGFSSGNRCRDGKWRSLEISIPGKELTVRARKGYFAR